MTSATIECGMKLINLQNQQQPCLTIAADIKTTTTTTNNFSHKCVNK